MSSPLVIFLFIETFDRKLTYMLRQHIGTFRRNIPKFRMPILFLHSKNKMSKW